MRSACGPGAARQLRYPCSREGVAGCYGSMSASGYRTSLASRRALRYVGQPSEVEKGDSEVAERRGRPGCLTSAHAREVLWEGLAAYDVVAVLYPPVPADVGRELRGSGLDRGEAGSSNGPCSHKPRNPAAELPSYQGISGAACSGNSHIGPNNHCTARADDLLRLHHSPARTPYLVGLGVEVALDDDEVLDVGRGGEQVGPEVLVQGSATKRVAVDCGGEENPQLPRTTEALRDWVASVGGAIE